MRPRRIDGNQKELVGQMRKIPGLTVRHTHMVGDGFVDITVGFRGRNYLLEIKDPAKPPSARKLTPDEEKFHAEWMGQAAVVETIDDVMKVLGI